MAIYPNAGVRCIKGENTKPIRNMNWVHAMWALIQFDASNKGLPSFKDAPTWTISSDNISEFSARTMVGKSEGLEVIELTVETDPIKVYRGLLAYYGRNICADLVLTYIDQSTSSYEEVFYRDEGQGTIGGGYKDSVVHPEIFGAYREDDPTTLKEVSIVVPKCTLVGLAPAGGENNSGSNTTIKLQPEGGAAINLPYVVKTSFYDKSKNQWDYKADINWGQAWDGELSYFNNVVK